MLRKILIFLIKIRLLRVITNYDPFGLVRAFFYLLNNFLVIHFLVISSSVLFLSFLMFIGLLITSPPHFSIIDTFYWYLGCGLYTVVELAVKPWLVHVLLFLFYIIFSIIAVHRHHQACKIVQEKLSLDPSISISLSTWQRVMLTLNISPASFFEAFQKIIQTSYQFDKNTVVHDVENKKIIVEGTSSGVLDKYRIECVVLKELDDSLTIEITSRPLYQIYNYPNDWITSELSWTTHLIRLLTNLDFGWSYSTVHLLAQQIQIKAGQHYLKSEI